MLVAVLLSGAAATAAYADTAPIPAAAALPWASADHQSPLELLATQIARTLAHNPAVSVQCSSQDDWNAQMRQIGDEPGTLGYVLVHFDAQSGAPSGPVSADSVAHLAPQVCLRLQQFAVATTKPTQCSPAPAVIPAPVPAQAKIVTRSVLATVRRPLYVRAKDVSAVRTATAVPAGSPVPCYVAGNKRAADMPFSYWSDYSAFALALLTLAHESVHLSGVIGGVTSLGVPVGDQASEAKANCLGMQWLPSAAMQLGASPADALAIAQFFYERIYSPLRTSLPAYWSADCIPGGTLDIRPAGSLNWP